MPHRLETRGATRTGLRRLVERLRYGRLCVTPLCLINIAATASVAGTLLGKGVSTLHGFSACAGMALAVTGLFWGAERAGGHPGRRLPFLPLALTLLALVSLGAAALTGARLGGPDALDPAAVRLHGQVAALALFVAPLSLAAAIQLRLSSAADDAPPFWLGVR